MVILKVKNKIIGNDGKKRSVQRTPEEKKLSRGSKTKEAVYKEI
jgi:hypothetical protein